MNKLYEMKLHEVLRPSMPAPVEIMRVPGGWIYTIWCERNPMPMTSTFVSFDNEFMKDE